MALQPATFWPGDWLMMAQLGQLVSACLGSHSPEGQLGLILTGGQALSCIPLATVSHEAGPDSQDGEISSIC